MRSHKGTGGYQVVGHGPRPVAGHSSTALSAASEEGLVVNQAATSSAAVCAEANRTAGCRAAARSRRDGWVSHELNPGAYRSLMTAANDAAATLSSDASSTVAATLGCALEPLGAGDDDLEGCAADRKDVAGSARWARTCRSLPELARTLRRRSPVVIGHKHQGRGYKVCTCSTDAAAVLILSAQTQVSHQVNRAAEQTVSLTMPRVAMTVSRSHLASDHGRVHAWSSPMYTDAIHSEEVDDVSSGGVARTVHQGSRRWRGH